LAIIVPPHHGDAEIIDPKSRKGIASTDEDLPAQEKGAQLSSVGLVCKPNEQEVRT
jgi:hypothetical protein